MPSIYKLNFQHFVLKIYIILTEIIFIFTWKNTSKLKEILSWNLPQKVDYINLQNTLKEQKSLITNIVRGGLTINILTT